MLEILLERLAQWKAEHTVERERMVAKQEQMASKRDQWAAKHTNSAKQSIADPRPNIYRMVDHIGYCGGAKELDRVLRWIC